MLENKTFSPKIKKRDGKYIYSYIIDDISERMRQADRERQRQRGTGVQITFDVLMS